MNRTKTFGAPVSRRALLGGAAALGGLTACGLAGCSSEDAPPEGATEGTLRVGQVGWVNSLSEEWSAELISKFEEEHEGVTVELIPVASSEATTEALVQKMSLEARQGESSWDLLMGPTPWIEVGALARADALLAVDDLIGDEFKDSIVDAARNEATAGDGNMYCIPFWSDVVGFMDRPSLQADNGVTPPQSWDELIAQTSAELPSDMYHYGADWTQIHRLFLPILATYTDSPFADNGTIDMSSPAALKALDVLKQLVTAMPAGAMTPGQHLDSFYANQVLSQTYWQTGIRAAIMNGIPEDDVTYRANLKGEREGTFFWSTSAVIPKGSAMPEIAAKFMTEGFASDWGIAKSVEVSQTIPPMKQLQEVTELSETLELAYTQLGSAIGLPANDAWLTVEQPNFKTAVERMMQEDLAPSEVQQTLTDAFAEYE